MCKFSNLTQTSVLNFPNKLGTYMINLKVIKGYLNDVQVLWRTSDLHQSITVR